MIAALLAATAIGSAAALATTPLPRLPRALRGRAGPRRSGSGLRGAMAALAGVAAWMFLGGALGIGAGVIATLLAWRTLGAREPAGSVRRREALDRDLPGAIQLLMSALRSGAAVETSLATVGEAVRGPVGEEFERIRSRLELGVPATVVWTDPRLPEGLRTLGRAMVRAQVSGAPVAIAGQRVARELGEQARAAVEQRAKAVSTKAAAPLGLCFLPAFVLLGIVPLVAGLMSGLRLL